LTQWEHDGMTLLSDRIIVTIWARRCAYGNDHYRSIISYLARINANKEGSTTLFINNLEIIEVFKDEDKEEEASVTDFIN